MKKIAVILGTRPEAIKLAPLINLMKKDEEFECQVCSTGQHKEMLNQVLEVFDLKVDIELSLMSQNQTLSQFTAKALVALDEYFEKNKPDCIIVQGDTTTVFASSLVAFYKKIPIMHIEAGLRSGDNYAPYPEEVNRKFASMVSTLHFAPTNNSVKNLENEGVVSEKILLSGNTIVDSLKIGLEIVENSNLKIEDILPERVDIEKRIVLVTGHRRENFGKGFESICNAIQRLAFQFPEVNFVFPVHLNPNVQEPVLRILGKDGCKNIHLLSPQSYLPFLLLMKSSYLILTDSGGIQEEAPCLGIPVLVMREVTERPEGVESGNVLLIGSKEDNIVNEVSLLLNNSKKHSEMSIKSNVYGDGKSSEYIIKCIKRYFSSTLGS
jgi:UDP-N-acetylglucosamine 2-epimerase (non-hydrolysing)